MYGITGVISGSQAKNPALSAVVEVIVETSDPEEINTGRVELRFFSIFEILKLSFKSS